MEVIPVIQIIQVKPPEIIGVLGSSTFVYGLSINTPVSSLDAYLENAGADSAKSGDTKSKRRGHCDSQFESDAQCVPVLMKWTAERCNDPN